MLVLVAVLLALVPAIAVLYPFIRRPGVVTLFEDESSARSELLRRWDSAVAGIRATELDRAVGNLVEDDYRSLREEYMTEAALAMKAMDLEEQQEQDLLAGIEMEVRRVRRGVQGGDGAEAAGTSLSGRKPGDE